MLSAFCLLLALAAPIRAASDAKIDRDHIALYDDGCCSWESIVIASAVLPLPKHLASADLTGIHTARGVRLGESLDQVRAAYGPAPSYTLASTSNLQRLTYATPMIWPHNDHCEERKAFFFRGGHLVTMRILTWC